MCFQGKAGRAGTQGVFYAVRILNKVPRQTRYVPTTGNTAKKAVVERGFLFAICTLMIIFPEHQIMNKTENLSVVT